MGQFACAPRRDWLVPCRAWPPRRARPYAHASNTPGVRDATGFPPDLSRITIPIRPVFLHSKSNRRCLPVLYDNPVTDVWHCDLPLCSTKRSSDAWSRFAGSSSRSPPPSSSSLPPAITSVECHQGVRSTQAGTTTERAVQEVLPIDSRQHLSRAALERPTVHAGRTQRALLSLTRIVHVDPPDTGCTLAFAMDRSEHRVDSVVEGLLGLSELMP